MFIMTIWDSYNSILYHFYVLHLNMEKSTTKMSKVNSSSPLASCHGALKNYPMLNRCDSFSSCSNDSSVYSGNNHTKRRVRNSKPIITHSIDTRMRTRNSSGSSISSNMSCLSDKDMKSSRTIPKSATKTEVNNCISDNTKIPPLNKSNADCSNKELKKETIVNEELDHSKNYIEMIPNRHNLRGKITKKGCTCCPSTHSTVVLRHYKKYIKTEEKTVISRTKSKGKTVISSTSVKTYLQENSPDVPQTDEECNISPNRSKSRKRRSEIEKLYASLHEIEWAKNFSPDNILRQINVRQAASCSAFGRPQTNKDSPEKNCKKLKRNDMDNSPHVEDSVISSEHIEPRHCRIISNMNKDSSSVTNCDNEQKLTDLQTSDITTPDIYHCKQNYKSCNSHSSVNITSVSHIVKEININSVESVHTGSLVAENGTDYSDDAQLSYTSDESSSAVSSSIVNLQSKHLLDFNFKNRNKRNLSDTDFSEYSTTTFFDIAEEGIRTIDACFREVGAEVVVSTCYDETSLPLLTSIRENKISNKVLEEPPVLEPCVKVDCMIKEAFNENFDNQIEYKTKCAIKDSSKLPVTDHNKIKRFPKFKHFNLNCCNCQNSVRCFNFKKSHPFLKLQLKVARKIVKKYKKLSFFKADLLKHKVKAFASNKYMHLPNRSDRQLCNINTYSGIKENQKSGFCQNSVLVSSSSKPEEMSYKTSDKTNNVIIHQIADADYPAKELIHSSTTKNESHLQNTGKVFECSRECRKQSIVSQTQSSSFISESNQSRPITSFVPTKVENNRIYGEHISRPTTSFGFPSDYRSIKVNKSYNYTQIILLVTRGKSIFLTLETLRELRDAVIRTNNDTNCQVLIFNGIGDSFCLGLDLKPLVGPGKKVASTQIAIAIKELIEALSDFKKPLAAVVNGPAVGLGMTLLNHADVTIASDNATFCMPYSSLGYMPEGGATLTLPQIVGSTVAMDLLLRGKTLTAREARNVGLISEVLEAKRLPHELVSRVRILAQNSLCALETTKSLVKMQLHANLQLVLENEVKLLPRMWLTRTCQDSLKKALESGILSK